MRWPAGRPYRGQRGDQLSAPRPGAVTLPAELLQQIIDAARAALPNESIGLLVAADYAGNGSAPSRYLPFDNAAASPFRYELDPAEQASLMPMLEDAGEVVWGIVHSHVGSPAVPSAADLRQAFYPESLYLICSLAEPVPQLRAWSITDGEVAEVTVSVG